MPNRLDIREGSPFGSNVRLLDTVRRVPPASLFNWNPLVSNYKRPFSNLINPCQATVCTYYKNFWIFNSEPSFYVFLLRPRVILSSSTRRLLLSGYRIPQILYNVTIVVICSRVLTVGRLLTIITSGTTVAITRQFECVTLKL